jgi:hypothetical protein
MVSGHELIATIMPSLAGSGTSILVAPLWSGYVRIDETAVSERTLAKMSKLKLKRSERAKDKANKGTDRPPMTSAPAARPKLYPGVLIGALAGIGGTLVMLQGTWTADRAIVAQHIGQILGAACIGALFGFVVARFLQAR